MALSHDLPLISTIAVGLSVAFIAGLIANKLRLPPVVGYLLAGIIIGPFTPGFTADIELAEQLSEIGVVLLLFGVGLHFSLQDLMQVRKIAITGAFLQISLVTAVGIGIGTLWGWPIATGAIFGLALSVASTVVILRLLEEYNMLSSITGKIAIGWLIVEDMAMVLAIILIPALAVTGDAAGASGSTAILTQIGVAVGKAIAFGVIMFVVGRRVLPWLLMVVARTGSRELFTLAVFAMSMGIAFGAATLFGVSFALGAFFAGMMIRESDLNHEVADRVMPFQDAFAVLFFVAVGMLFNPAILWEEPLKVLITAFIIIIGKSIVTFATVKLFRYPTSKALMVSASLAQIGEFSFILIALGASVGMLNDEARNLILAGAMVSIALNPALFGWVRNFGQKISGQDVNDDTLAHLAVEEAKSLKDTVILIGYGKVGSEVAQALNEEHIDLVIVDENRETVEALRKKGFHAIYGEASDAVTLQEAFIEKAKTVVITLPDPFEVCHIVERTKELNPSVKIIVRAHNEEEIEFFKSHDVDLTVSSKEEIARRMVWAVEEFRGA